MALFHITIEKLVVNSDNGEACELREKIKELEAQQDSWLKTLKAQIDKLKTVSEEVDSKT